MNGARDGPRLCSRCSRRRHRPVRSAALGPGAVSMNASMRKTWRHRPAGGIPGVKSARCDGGHCGPDLHRRGGPSPHRRYLPSRLRAAANSERRRPPDGLAALADSARFCARLGSGRFKPSRPAASAHGWLSDAAPDGDDDQRVRSPSAPVLLRRPTNGQQRPAPSLRAAEIGTRRGCRSVHLAMAKTNPSIRICTGPRSKNLIPSPILRLIPVLSGISKTG
jgi:hypothetical protein